MIWFSLSGLSPSTGHRYPLVRKKAEAGGPMPIQFIWFLWFVTLFCHSHGSGNPEFYYLTRFTGLGS